MPRSDFSHPSVSINPHQRKGAVVVLVAVLLVVMLGCVALTVDIGHLYVARTELQRTADAAAMAGVQALARGSQNPFGTYSPSSQTIYDQVQLYANLNTVLAQGVAINPESDVAIGYIATPRDLTDTMQTVPLESCNAVRVIARRDADHAGGKIKLLFGPLFGIHSSAVGASATAVLDDRFVAYAPKTVGGVPAIPIAINAEFWDDQVVLGNGPDDYSYNSSSDSIETAPDNLSEIQLFPTRLGPTSEEEAGAGNFTLLHIGSGSLGTSELANQIENGVSPEDFVDLTGEPMIEFYSENSEGPVTYEAVSYDVLGDPGLKAGLKASLQEKVGQVVGFFIYDNVTNDGSNSVFRISGMRFGRVMEVDLTGSDKILVVQPVPYYGPDIVTSPDAPSTDRLIGSLQLVR